MSRPEQLWVSDITYIKTENGLNYLALVIDAFSKQIMDYKLDNHMRTTLCSDTLAMTIKNRNILMKNSLITQTEAFNTVILNIQNSQKAIGLQ